jgi:hypothetical protein
MGSAMKMRETIQLMKREGARLAEPIVLPGAQAMTFGCSFSELAAPIEDLEILPGKVPVDLCEFWNEAESARLFVDQTYGQWGLEIFSPRQALVATEKFRSERGRDFVAGDLVVGRFLGDSDLLLVGCNPEVDDYGTVTIALPLDRRNDWYRPARRFADFLETYARSGGKKFWEAG